MRLKLRKVVSGYAMSTAGAIAATLLSSENIEAQVAWVSDKLQKADLISSPLESSSWIRWSVIFLLLVVVVFVWVFAEMVVERIQSGKYKTSDKVFRIKINSKSTEYWRRLIGGMGYEEE